MRKIASYRAREKPDGKWTVEAQNEETESGWVALADDVEFSEVNNTVARLRARRVLYFDKDGKLIE